MHTYTKLTTRFGVTFLFGGIELIYHNREKVEKILDSERT